MIRVIIMSRKSLPNDFTLTVDGIGTFVFGRRTMRDEIKMQVEYAKLIDGATPTEWLASVCGWIACLKVMTVSAPDGWDIDLLDPMDDVSYTNLAKVYVALDNKERSFRTKSEVKNTSVGLGNVGDGGVLVQAEVQPDPI